MSDSTQHTQGLLKACGVNIYAEDHTTFVASTCAGNTYSSSAEANARRIVACWNDCDGLNTETLELVPRFTEAGVKTVKSVEAERDALRAEVERLKTVVCRVAGLNPDAGEIGAGMLVQLVDSARAALKGGA